MTILRPFIENITGAISIFVASSTATDAEKVLATPTYTCDATADNVQIQAALDALPATGGIVQLSSGTFTTGANGSAATVFFTREGTWLRGMGHSTLIKPASGATGAVIDTRTSGGAAHYWCKVSDLRIDGNHANCPAGTVGIQFGGASGDNSTIGYIDHVEVDECMTWGVSAEYVYNSWITNSSFMSNEGGGLNLTSVGGNNILFCNFWDNDNRAIYGLAVETFIIDCWINNTTEDVSGGEGIYLVGAPWNVLIHKCQFDGNFRSAFKLNVTSAASVIQVIDNTFMGQDATHANEGACVHLYSSEGTPTLSDVIVTGNVAETKAGNSDYNYFLQIDSGLTVARLVCTDNSINPAAFNTGFISNAGTLTGPIINNNAGYIAPGEERTASGALVPTGTCTATTVTGVFTESPAALVPGVNTLHCTTDGTLSVVIPTGSTAVVTSGDATVTDSPKSLVAGTTVVTVATGAGADDFTITLTSMAFTWQNPEAQAITIIEAMVDVTTAGGTANSILDVGSAANATTHGDDLIWYADLNTTETYVSSARIDVAANGGAADYITGQIITAKADSLVGKYYIKYVGA